MSGFRMLPVLCCFLMLGGCGERKADLASPNSHTSGSICFEYPGNWTVSDEEVTEEFQSLFIESPGDAVVILQAYPVGEANSLAEFAADFSEMSANEIPIGKMTDSDAEVLPEADGFEWLRLDFEMKLLGQTIPHRRLFGSKVVGDKRVFLMFQVATEDFAEAEQGFQMIQGSLEQVEEVLEGEAGGPEKP